VDCIACQAELPPQARFCPTCGAPQGGAVTGPTQRLSPQLPTKPLLRRGTCPQCSATEVYTNRDLPASMRTNTYGANSIPIYQTILKAEYAECIYYVCATCGYIERYIADSYAIDAIRHEWTQVDPAV
jgi:hypothetical protein